MRRKWGLITGAVISAFATPLVHAQNAAVLAEKFGALESVQQISLSPDGIKAAYITPARDGVNLVIADLMAGGASRPILTVPSKDGNLRWCSWATPTRLICNVTMIAKDMGQLIGFSRMFALNSDGSQISILTVNTNFNSTGILQSGGSVIDWDVPEKPNSVLMTRVFIPEVKLGTRVVHDLEGLGVEEVDTLTLKRRILEQPKKGAAEYISDGQGTIRILGIEDSNNQGLLTGRSKYLYRKPGSRDWEVLSIIEQGENSGGFVPYAVDSAKNVVYGFDDNQGFSGLYSIALDGTGKKELVLGRTDVDIDDLIQIGRDNRVVGASYATERRTTEFFDPSLRKLIAALGKALPGEQSISIIDSSSNEAKLLILASSDTNPGMFYLFDKTSRQLEEVLPVRDQLSGVPMGTMKPVTYTASDGTPIPAYLTLPPGRTGKGLPAIVMPHGGPGSRDEWGFDWLAQFYAARGFAVLQPNFRGSAGYGSAWYQKNGFKSWRIAIGDVNDAGRWLLSQGIAAPGKLGIVGWSYGGYAALQSSVVDPDLFKAIVAVASVTDLDRLREESRDFTNYNLVDTFIGRGAHIREGSPAQNVDRIKAPVLLFHGDRDQNVGIGESRLMADRLRGAGKSVEIVEFPGLDHQLASAAARTRILSQSDAFLRKAMGLPPE
jgi:dipeptidyl aminopeptidase/acylaminoacyl peptidase